MVAQCDICKAIEDNRDGWMFRILFPHALAYHIKDWAEWEIDMIDDNKYVSLDLCPCCVNMLSEQLATFAKEGDD